MSGLRRLAIVGASSPFTAALIDALADRAASIPPHELRLQGNTATHLSLIARYARVRLPDWPLSTTADPARAVDGVEVVLHQPRYGGLELRELGEQLCARHGVLADETLGPAALLCAIRIRSAVLRMAELTRTHAPGAWVLNLTNPLSLVTGWFADAGVSCLGLCELPVVTLDAVARLLGRPGEKLEWHYIGLNHRGFLHALAGDERDLLAEIVHCLDGAELEGIAAATIERVGAVPLKYFQWFERPGRLASPRARDLMDLRGDIAAELAGSADVRPLPRPPGLARRYLQWYPRAVVPVVEALATDRTIVLTVNRADQGLVREMKVTVGATRVINDPGPPPPEPVAEWVRRFEMHERALQTAAAAPDRDRIEQALALDPVVPDHAVAALTAELLEVAPA